MTTPRRRLQISLPQRQIEFLAERARQEGVSVAEVVRRIVAGAAQEGDALWEIAGMAEDQGELVGGLAVSERPELYGALIT